MRNNTVKVFRPTISYSAPAGSPGTQTNDEWQTKNFIVTQDVTTGVKTDLHPHAYSYTHTSRRLGNKKTVFGGSIFIGETVGVVNEGPIPILGWSTEAAVARQKALSRFYQKYRGNLDLSTDAFQLRQTAAMARSALLAMSSLGKLASSISGSLNTRKAADKYLEWTYGWMPTLQSITDLWSELGNYPPLKVEGTATERRNVSRTVQGPFGTKNLETLETILSCRHKFYGEIRITDHWLDQLARYTAVNPLSIAWELTKLSFVVDWFYDIGGYLRDYETALLTGTRWSRGFETSSVKSYAVVKHNGAWADGDYVTSANYSGWQIDAAKHRAILGAPPTPNRPTFRVDLGSRRLLTAAALVRQRM